MDSNEVAEIAEYTEKKESPGLQPETGIQKSNYERKS